MNSRLSLRDLVLSLAVVVVWGYSFVPIKVALTAIPPFALAALRFLFAAVPMCLLVRPPVIPARPIVVYGLVVGVCQFGLLFMGMQLGMPAGLSSLAFQTQVFFTVGLAVVFLGEPLQRHNIIGAGIAAAGMVVLGVHEMSGGAIVGLAGFLLVIAGAFAWAVANIIVKRVAGSRTDGMLALMVWSSLVPPLPLAAISYAFEGGPAVWDAVRQMSLLTGACVLFLSYGATLFAFATWNALLRRYPTPLITPFALLIPVTGFESGILFLGESLAALQLLGALLVFAGLLINLQGPRLMRFLLKRASSLSNAYRDPDG